MILYRVLRDTHRWYLRRIEDVRRFQRRKYIRTLGEILPSDVSIICSNCFGGRIYTDLKRTFLSPTEGLFFPAAEFNKFCSRIEYYIKECELSFTDTSKYPGANQRRERLGLTYPIGLLDDVEIHFLHYKTAEEAASKWNRRKQRINYDKLLFIGMQQNYCTPKDIIDFDKIAGNKIFYATKSYDKLQSVASIDLFKDCNEIGDAFHNSIPFYQALIRFLETRRIDI